MSFSTIFPPVPQTVWLPGDPALHIEGNGTPDLRVRGPHMALDAGMFGVESQLSAEAGEGEIPVADVQITMQAGENVLAQATILARQINQSFQGMYGGARLNLIIDQRAENVEFQVHGRGVHPIHFQGLKLIPRPGHIWFPFQLEHDPSAWQHNPDRSATCLTPTTLGGPLIFLPPNDYRVGIKFLPPSDFMSVPIAEISAASSQGVICPLQIITTEEVRARFGIPDSKLRFRLNQDTPGVRLPIRTLVPGVTVQWVRLATADESVWQHYYNMGGLASPLGAPASGFDVVYSGIRNERGFVRRFERGCIYWTILHGPCEVFGPIQAQYEARGGVSGPFGFPISRPETSASTILQDFEGGAISAES